MQTIRRSQERGYADHGWLQSYHSFSFAGYYDPKHMGWGNLRVINDDVIAPDTGFGTHGHRNMEIISYVTAGNLAHKDSIGNVEGIPAGDVQRMSAGSGVLHSEFNYEQGRKTSLLQIWIEPDTDKLDVQPSYEQISVPSAEKQGQLRLIAGPEKEAVPNQIVAIHADARVYAGIFDGEQKSLLNIAPNRKAYVHVVKGSLTVNGARLKGGDALILADETQIELSQGEQAEVLVFDLKP